MQRPAIVAAILIGLFCFAYALGQSNRTVYKQQGTIGLGSVELTLGMSQDVALARLAESYDLQKAASESWIVEEKSAAATKSPPHVLGSVNFANTKLIAVYKDWGPEDQQKGIEFARGIYGAIASFVNRGKTDCRISVGETQEPTFEDKTAFIHCGDESIQVEIGRTKTGEFSSVEEFLRSQ